MVTISYAICSIPPWALAVYPQTAWPSKPVKLVVAFQPGGVADVMSRVVSQPLSRC